VEQFDQHHPLPLWIRPSCRYLIDTPGPLNISYIYS